MEKKILAEASTSSTFCLERIDDTYKLRLRHDYQILCQLCCTERNWCDFVSRMNKDITLNVSTGTKDSETTARKTEEVFLHSSLSRINLSKALKGEIKEPQYLHPHKFTCSFSYSLHIHLLAICYSYSHII